MGSVKDLIVDERTLAGKLYNAPQPHVFGQGVWEVSGRFSVGDLKDKIPDREIDGKKYALAMMTAAYFEHADAHGMPSCYLGMMDANGNITDTSTLLDRGELSNHIVMKLANTPADAKTPEGLRAYHKAVRNGTITTYVADAESIFRAGFPLGSSSFKKIFQHAGQGDIYESLATYDETVRVLDDIRSDVTAQGWEKFQKLRAYLDELTLVEIPNPGKTIEKPVLNFTTKFALSGDEDITNEEARTRMGLSREAYGEWKQLVYRGARDQINYSKERGIVNIDGKLEAVVHQGKPLFTDFANTPDENRLMIIHKQDGIKYLLPTNKEIQRAIFRARGIYTAIDQAKAHAQRTDGTKDTWRNHLTQFASDQKIQEVTEESCRVMENAIKFVANQALQRNIFGVPPIGSWVADFLPYASRVQN